MYKKLNQMLISIYTCLSTSTQRLETSPDKTVQEIHVLAITDVLANHLLVQPVVFSKPLSNLTVVHGVAEKTFLLQELDAFFGFLVKLLCACYEQLEPKNKDERCGRSFLLKVK